jgi:hypothetical protein
MVAKGRFTSLILRLNELSKKPEKTTGGSIIRKLSVYSSCKVLSFAVRLRFLPSVDINTAASRFCLLAL